MHFINDESFGEALKNLRVLRRLDDGEDEIHAIAPLSQKISPGSGAIHMLAFAGGKKGADQLLVGELATELCKSNPHIFLRNSRGLFPTHVAASSGNGPTLQALLEAKAGTPFLS